MAVLFPIPIFIGAALIMLAVMALVVVASFFTIRIVFSHEKSSVMVYEMLVVVEWAALQRTTVDAARSIVSTSISAQQQVVINSMDGAFLTIGLALLAAGGVIILVWHDSIVTAWLQLSQCGIAPLRDKFVLQLVNLGALAYDVFNPLLIGFWRLMAALTFVPPLTFAACTDTTVIWDALAEIGHALAALLFAFVEVLQSESPADEPLDLTPFMYHLGKAFDLLGTSLHCVCGFFDFLWVPLLHLPSFTSLAVEVDCLANIPFSTLQLIVRPFAYNGTFTVIPFGEQTTCAWLGLADIQQDLLLQIMQIFTGVFSEILTPCSLFDGDPTGCDALGHCSIDVHTNLCRDITVCDGHATREACVADSACCFDALATSPLFTVDFVCDAASQGLCPAGGNAGCGALSTVAACNAFNGVCLWDNTGGVCASHETICATYTSDVDCRRIPTFCSAFPDATSCTTEAANLCYWTNTSCISQAEACIDAAPPDPNTACAPKQLCGWNYNQSLCLPRDVNASIEVASVRASRNSVNAALHVPGSDAPPDTIGKLIGVPVVLAALEVQWAHSGIFIGNEIVAFIFMTLVMVVETLVHAPTTLGQYDGLAKLRIGYLFDFVRSWLAPIAQIGVLLDIDLPCALQDIIVIPADAVQGLVELFFLVIFFPIYQPTGPAASVNLWSPFDFLASYWNDTKIPFSPLIFVNGVVQQRSYWGPDSQFPDLYTHNCIVYPTLCDLIINLDTDVITVSGVDYSFDNVSLSGTLVTRVDIFPGIDRTIPRIIDDIKGSSFCLERVVGDGTNSGENRVPWACAIRHAINVLAELLNILGQIIFYIADILRFTDDPPYRKTPRDIYIEGFYTEWRAMSHCIANIIRLFESNSTFGLCKQLDTFTFTPVEMDTFICCLARLVELLLSGAILTTIHEASLFARDLFSIKFILADGSGFYLPSLTAILDDIDATTDALACTISDIIPDAFKCPLDIAVTDICTIFDGAEFINIQCDVEFECKRGNSCLHKFIASLFKLVTTPFRLVDRFYASIRAAVSVQCHTLSLSECADRSPPCIIVGLTCVSPSTPPLTSAFDIVTLIVDLIKIPLGALMHIVFNFALLLDCLTCAVTKLNAQDVSDTPCTTGTPFFDFVYNLLGVLFSLLDSLLTLIVSLIVMVFVLIVAAVTGDFALITETFDSLGAGLADSFNLFGKRLLVALVEALHLEDIYNGIVNLINNVILPVCGIVADITDFLNDAVSANLPSPDCEALRLPDLNTTGLLIPVTPCNNITVEHYCTLLPNCLWTGAACIDRVGCAKGINREACTQAALDLGNVHDCYWQVGDNSPSDATPREQGCFNTADTGFPACAGSRTLTPTITTACTGGCTGSTNAVSSCMAPRACTVLPQPIPMTSISLEICAPSFGICDTDNCGCHTFDGDRAGCSGWPGVCFWLPGTSECVNSYAMCARPNHMLLNEVPSAPLSLYTFGGAPVPNNFCALAIDLCFPYTTLSDCEDAMNHNQCQWIASGLTQTDFYDTSTVPSFTTALDLSPFATSAVSTGACVSRVGYARAVQHLALDQTKFQCVPRTDAGGNAPHYCVPIDTSERITLSQTVSGVTYSLGLEEPMKRKRSAPVLPDGRVDWAADDACAQYAGMSQEEVSALMSKIVVALVNGSYDAFGAELYCVGRLIWLRNITGASVPPPTADTRAAEKLMRADCDTLFRDYYNVSAPGVSWETLRPLERVHLTECTKWRLLGDFARVRLGYSWLPSDIFYNSLRKWQLLATAARGYSVYRQYSMDRSMSPDVVLTAAYRAGAASRNVADPVLADTSIVTHADLQLALDGYSLHDYFVANNLTDTEYAMTLDLVSIAANVKTIAGGAFGSAFAGFMQNTSKPIDFWGLLANGSRVDLQRIFTTSVISSVSAAFNATAIVAGAATTGAHYKRAVGATAQLGRLITNGFAVLRGWIAQNNTFARAANEPKTPGLVSRVYSAVTGGIDAVATPMLARWSGRVRATNTLLWRNARGAERRDKFRAFGAQLNYTFHNILVAELRPDTAAYRLRVQAEAPSWVSGYVRSAAALIPPLECVTNTSNIGTTWFCDNCLVGDGILGRVYWIIIWISKFFTGSDPVNYPVNFPNSYARFKSYAAYLADDSAPVQIGGSPTNPLLWPYSPVLNVSNWAPFGDSTPNKKRFYDYGDLWIELVAAAEIAASDPHSLLIVQLLDSALNSLFVATSAPVFNAAARASGLFMRGSNTTAVWMASPNSTRVAAPRPPGEILSDIVKLVFSQAVLCSFPLGHEGELDGRGKRFAIAEILGIATIATLIVVPFVLAASSAGIITVMTGMSLTGMFGIVFFLTITYNWSFLCWPALPQPLGDDVRDFIGFTVQPKCPWFAMGTLREDYRGDNCYTCAQARTFTSSHCVRDWKFFTIFDNLAFTTVAWLPDLPAVLTELGLAGLVNGTVFGTLINKWEAAYVPNDTHNYAALWTCNGWWTLWPNIFLFAFAIQLLRIIAPYLSVLVVVASYLWTLIYSAFFVVYVGFVYISMLASTAPFLMTYGVLPDTILSGPAYAASAAYSRARPTVPTGSPLATLWNETRQAIGESALGVAAATLRRRARGGRDDENGTDTRAVEAAVAYDRASREMISLLTQLRGGEQV